jgi:hypothetical protein
MAGYKDKAVAPTNSVTDPARRLTDFLTNFGNTAPIKTLADLLSASSAPMAPGATTSQQTGPYQGPLATDVGATEAPAQQPGMMEQALRYLGLR